MPSGQVTSYSLTNGVIVNMDEAIYLYSPEELPMLTGMGADGLSVIGSDGLDQVSFSWLDEENLAPRSTLSANLTTADTLVFAVATGDQLKFSTGDIVMVRKAGVTQPETMRVLGYSATTADMLIVSRALTGTATNYASGAVVIGLGTALAEGSDPEAFRAVDTTTRSNNTQIFGPTKIEMSGTALVVPRYGKPNEWTHQLHHRILENGQSREQAFIYGQQYNSTTTKIRTTGGLNAFIATNIDATGTQVTETRLQTNMQTCYNRGGVPDRFMCNPNALGDLNDITNTGRVRQEFVDGRRGRQRVTVVSTEYGDLTIVRNRWVHPYDGFGFRREGVTRRVLRQLQFEMLAKTGDSQKGQIVCEEGLEVKGEKHMFHMNALSY